VYFLVSKHGHAQHEGIVADGSVRVGEDLGFFGTFGEALTVRFNRVVFVRMSA
jgi:hypothetical protein